MKKKSRTISSFNLSFLDIMLSGFGAVVLFVLIINSHIVTETKEKFKDLTAEVTRVEHEIKAAELYKRNIQNKISDKEQENKTINSHFEEISRQVEDVQKKETLSREQSLALKKHINRLQNDLKKSKGKSGKSSNSLISP